MTSIKIGTLVKANQQPTSYIKQIIPHGFESFQLMFWKNLGECTDLPALADSVNRVLDGTGITISSLGIFGNPLETDEDDKATLHAWEQLIEHAHLFNTDIVAGFTGRLRNQSIPDSIARFKEIFQPLTEKAGEKNVKIAFENCSMNGTWQTGDWNIAHNPDAWELMFDAIPLPNIGIEWEPCHQMIQLIEPLPQIREWADRIFHVHGKCATIDWPAIRKHGIHGKIGFAKHRHPGFGDCDWTDVISELRKIKFEGAIDIEGWHDPVYRDELEMTGQVRSLNYLKECRGGNFVPNPS